MKILGIDPGLHNLAFAFLEIKNEIPELKTWETFTTNKLKTDIEKLTYLFNSLKKIVKKIKPDIIGVEDVFVKPYSKAGTKLAQVQTIVLIIAGLYQIPIKVYHPLEIKKFFTQYGKSKKEDLSHILNLLIKEKIVKVKENFNPDPHKMDALAIALIIAWEQNR